MRSLLTTFALSALAAMAAALAQQTAPPPSTDSPPPAQYPNSTPPPPGSSSDPSTDSSHADKAMLMKQCMAQVQASNPGVPENDVKNFCAKEVYRPPPQ